ncbi:DUF4231 domain-containing protein [Streptomyces tateyamensis]|uniref:DUF4231 domain-containing protein n=1 Tax=Streptomyces tateyamensis TaxID=565073 RepID=A0A2V4PM54_9ACTN|nr:DUF4231 domain-containing protein [Streptomyces tateyamensis]PYC85368.1 DUF4231 domain-containing protein [Streptomyces tateyamensis]
MAGGGEPTDPVSEQRLLPELFRLADGASLLGQRRAVSLVRWELALLTGAAALAALGPAACSWAAAAGYLAAAVLAALLTRQQPQGLWYEGRAAAESVKTLAWKYAVRADQGRRPPTGPPDAERLYHRQLADLLRAFRDSPVLPADPGQHTVVTEAMRELRAQPLAVRREVYLRERVEAQRAWYRDKAAHCDRAGRLTDWLGVLLPGLALPGAVLRALGLLGLEPLGALSALAASVIAWSQLRQYRPLAAAYRLAAEELALVREQLAGLDPAAKGSEELWARLARDAEDAVSREHTTWQARREVRDPGD